MGSCISNNIQNTDIDIDTNIRKSNIPVINLPIFDKKNQQLDSNIVRRLTTIGEEDTVSVSDLSSSS